MLFKEKIFREYDIRGVVDTDFGAEFARLLGLSFAAKVLADTGADIGVPRIAVARDCRVSGESLSAALIEGLRQGGLNVVDCGMGPTPQLYFSVYKNDFDAGIQVTGSHNPSDQNGFKMMIGKTTLSGDAIVDLKQRVEALSSASAADGVAQEVRGTLENYDANTPYIADLIERSSSVMGERRLKVVVDSGNGVGGLAGPEVLKGLGCDVISLFEEPDGTFPNHHPDPTVLSNIVELRKRVVEEKADFGIGYDGDADRIGVVDEKGEPVYGDMLLLLFGRQLLKEVENPTIIGDVKCSEILFSQLEKEGANAVMAKTGHSLIKAKLKELKAELAGEMSGHIFFSHRYLGFDDAIHASARLAEIVSNTQKSVSELLSDVPKMVCTPELRIDCPDEVKFEIVSEAQKAFPEYEINTLDGIRMNFPEGWGLVRASNTQAALVMRFEASSGERLSEYQEIVEKRIAEIKERL